MLLLQVFQVLQELQVLQMLFLLQAGSFRLLVRRGLSRRHRRQIK